MTEQERMNVLKDNHINTDNFFNVSVDVPVGSSLKILVNGIPYTIEPGAKDAMVEKIKKEGYVFNRKTDGRYVAAQTLKMLERRTYNSQKNIWENTWDACLRNSYDYMYQFSMLKDELHRLAKMEKQNDPAFAVRSKFFTKTVVIELVKQYKRQIEKYVKKAPSHTCKNIPYVKFAYFRSVYLKDMSFVVYQPIDTLLSNLNHAKDFSALEKAFTSYFRNGNFVKLPRFTPKCKQWKTAFKGLGAYLTLMNLIKWHGATIQDKDMYESVAYLENLLSVYSEDEYWKFHELLKEVIAKQNITSDTLF